MPLGASRVPFNIHLQIQQNLEITITRTILNRSDLKTESTIGNSIAINLKNGFELETQKLRLPKIKLGKKSTENIGPTDPRILLAVELLAVEKLHTYAKCKEKN